MAGPYLPPQTYDGIIDISHYQPTADFNAVKADGIDAVFIKATQGVHGVDPLWPQHLVRARDAGLLTALYHFCTGDPAQDQAAHFLNETSVAPGALVMLDFENNPMGRTATADQVAELGKAIMAVTGRAPVIYCGRWQIAAPHPVLSAWPLMLPEYGYSPVCPPGWQKWVIHQYTGSGRVNGIPGDVDRSVFAGTRDELAAWWSGACGQGATP